MPISELITTIKQTALTDWVGAIIIFATFFVAISVLTQRNLKMPKVKSFAIMETDLEWEGYIPDDVPPEKYWLWIRDNVDGGEFTDTGCGDWVWGQDVDVIDDDEEVA